MSLASVLEKRSAEHPHRCAIAYEGKKISYSTLNKEANRRCGFLRGEGIKPGDKIILLLSNRPDYIYFYYAAFKLGVACVPLNTYLTPSEIEYIVNDCQAKAMIYENKFSSHVKGVGEISKINIEEISINSFPDTNPSDKVHTDELAVIIYTSGTTGHPKGVKLSHQNLLSNVESCRKALNYDKKQTVIGFLPLFHSFTFTACVLVPIGSGAKLVLIPGIERDKIKKSIIRHRVRVFVGIPTIYKLLSQQKVSYIKRLLNPVRLYISGGAPLPLEVLESFEEKYRRPLLEGYGLSEASPVVSFNPIDGNCKPGSVGLPLPDIQVKVIDDDGADLPVNEVGELLVRGPNVMEGYYNKPQETQDSIKDGWLYTGDLARIDEDGFIFIEGRKKELIIVHGCNVYPREVEEVFCSHPAVAEAAVIGVPDESRGEVPKAFIVLTEGQNTTQKELKTFCQDKLATYKVPHQIDIIDSLPKTATGKVKKHLLS
jgi:long-chain acyl-CoA synthetase